MTTHHTAQGLASLGRGNDTMLMHVTPREVAGLQSIAMASGGSLTINPHTGLPEAGFFDAIFDFAAPIIGGYFGMDPFLMAGIMGGKSLVEEGDPLQAAFSAFGGYSGAKLGSGFESFGKAPTIPTAELNTFENAASNIEKMDPTNLMQADKAIGADKAFGFADTTPYNQLGTQGAGINLGQSPQVNQVFNQSPAGQIGYPNFSNPTIPTEVFGKAPGAPGVDLTSGATQGVQIPGATEPISPIQGFGQDVMTAGRSPVDFARHIGEGNALTGGAKIGMYAASPFMESILQPPEPVAFKDPDEGKWRSDTGGLSLSSKFDTGLRLKPLINVREGGAISGYAAGGNVSTGTVTTGGLSDLYGATDLQSSPSLSRDGYGIGRLDTLVSEGSRAKAADTFYAEGGKVNAGGFRGDGYGGDGMSRLNMDALVPIGPIGSVKPDPLGNDVMSRIAFALKDPGALNIGRTLGYAEGGETHLNLDQLPSLNVNTGTQEYNSLDGFSTPMPELNQMIALSRIPQVKSDNVTMFNPFNVANGVIRAAANGPKLMQTSEADRRAQLEQIFNPAFKNLQMAKGGYLDGAGDGMSDSIPATIEGKQPARLADGEFVVPADVVSHLGNGSSKAGSKRLYAMLDKVRKARTGHTKQGKQINPNKYMPA